MKQIRMMALLGLTLLMGVIMTSCLSSSEGDNKATQTLVAIYENGAFTQQGGGILVPVNSSFLPSAPGFYLIEIEYDPTTWSDNKLNVTLLSAPQKVETYNVVKGTGEGNINLYTLQESSSTRGTLAPSLFNKDYLVIPCIFWADDVNSESEKEQEIKKHHFNLQAPADMHNSEGVLELTLYDVVDDPDLQRLDHKYVDRIYYIGDIINEFNVSNSVKVSKIRIKAKVNRSTYETKSGGDDFFDIDLTPFQ